MTLEKIIQDIPELGRINPDVMDKIAIRINGLPLDYNKTWSDNGYNDLDTIEMLMLLEKELNIDVPDEIVDYLFSGNVKPPKFISVIRDKKLSELGI